MQFMGAVYTHLRKYIKPTQLLLSTQHIKSTLSKFIHEPKITLAGDYIRANEILNFLKTYLYFNFDGIASENVANASIADISALFERNIEYFKKYKVDENGFVTKEEGHLIAWSELICGHLDSQEKTWIQNTFRSVPSIFKAREGVRFFV